MQLSKILTISLSLLFLLILSSTFDINAIKPKTSSSPPTENSSKNLFSINPILGCLLLQSGKMQRMIQNINIPSVDGINHNVSRGGGVYISKNFNEALRNIIFMLFPSKDKVLSLVRLQGSQLTKKEICCLQRYAHDLAMMKIYEGGISDEDIINAKRVFYFDRTYLSQGDRFFKGWWKDGDAEIALKKVSPQIGTLGANPLYICSSNYELARYNFISNMENIYKGTCIVDKILCEKLDQFIEGKSFKKKNYLNRLQDEIANMIKFCPEQRENELEIIHYILSAYACAAFNITCNNTNSLEEYNSILKKLFPEYNDSENPREALYIKNFQKEILSRTTAYSSNPYIISNIILPDYANADCGETTIRHILNLITFDNNRFNRDGILASRKSNNADANLTECLKTFYNLQTVDMANSPNRDLVKAFMNIVNGHSKEGIKYISSNTELMGNIENIINTLRLILGENTDFEDGDVADELTRIFGIISQNRYKFHVVQCNGDAEERYLVKAFAKDYDFSQHDADEYNQDCDEPESDTLFSFYINILGEHSDIKIQKGISPISCAEEVKSKEIIKCMTDNSLKNVIENFKKECTKPERDSLECFYFEQFKIYLNNPENILTLKDTNLLLNFLDEIQIDKNRIYSHKNKEIIIKAISDSVSNLNCDLKRLAESKYDFPHLNSLTVTPGNLDGNLDLNKFAELQFLKCNNGMAVIKGDVIIPDGCSNLECIQANSLKLSKKIDKLNMQNCNFSSSIDIDHDYENISIECWDSLKQYDDNKSTMNTLNFSKGTVCKNLYTEKCEVNNFVFSPNVKECCCYNGVLNNMDFEKCSKKTCVLEFEKNIFNSPKFSPTGEFTIWDLKLNKIID